jgi:hypothetical protein
MTGTLILCLALAVTTWATSKLPASTNRPRD